MGSINILTTYGYIYGGFWSKKVCLSLIFLILCQVRSLALVSYVCRLYELNTYLPRKVFLRVFRGSVEYLNCGEAAALKRKVL